MKQRYGFSKFFRSILQAMFIAMCVLTFLTCPTKAQAELRDAATGWEYRWGDSPRAPNGSFVWMASNETSSNWTKPETPYHLTGRDKNRFLWMRLALPNKIETGMVLKLVAVDQVFETYVDSYKVYEFGVINSDSSLQIAGNPFHVIRLHEAWAGKYMYFRVASDHKNIGIYKMPVFGTEFDVLKAHIKDNISKLVVALIAFCLGILGILFLAERDLRKIYTYLLVFSFSLSLYMVLRTKLTDYFLGYALLRLNTENYLIYLIGYSFMGLLANFFGLGYKSAMGVLSLAFGSTLIVVLIATVFGLESVFKFQPFLWALCLAAAVAMLISVVKMSLQGRREARIFSAGAVIVAASIFVDVFSVMKIWAPKGEYVFWGFSAMLLSLGQIVAGRYIDTLNKRNFLSHRLDSLLAATTDVGKAQTQVDAAATGLHYLQREHLISEIASANLYFSPYPGTFEKIVVMTQEAKIFDSVGAPIFPILPDSLVDFELCEPVQKESLLTFPIPLSGNRKCILEICDEKLLSTRLSADDFSYIAGIGRAIGAVLDSIFHTQEVVEQTRMRSELQAAETVQKTLLPSSIELPGVSIQTYSLLASEVGGDWFGYYHAEKTNRLFFYIGDVTGHGVSSAIISGVACGAIYGCEKILDSIEDLCALTPEKHLLEVARSLNDVIYKTGRSADRLMTMALGCLDVSSGTVFIINAGHPHPFVLSPTENSVKNILAAGNRMGTMSGSGMQVVSHQLKLGDSLFFYTDGLVENTENSSKPISHLTLKDLLKENIYAEDLNSVVLARFRSAMSDALNSIADDVSLLRIRWTAETSRQSKIA